MTDFLLTHYPLLRALHIIAIIAWMAGLLYLPRLYVYHAEAENGSDKAETFKIMERRLYTFIMTPAMGASWVFGGLMLIANPALLEVPWMHVKLLCVVLMTGTHHVFGRWRKVFERDENTRSPRFYKIWNEAPTLLMLIIVIMAVTEPL